MSERRLRVFDLNTRWFWLVIFAQRLYGKPRLEVLLWPPNRWGGWWLHVWKREELSDERGGEVVSVDGPEREQE